MAPKTTLNEENLKGLGAERLADLVMKLVAGNAVLKRQARAALLEEAGVAHLAAEVRKRIASLKRARSFVEWHKQKALVADLDRQRDIIADKIAPSDPAMALDLTWRFLELAAPTFERADDSNGRIGDVFRAARAELETILPAAKPDPTALAEQVFARTIEANDYGEYDGLIDLAGPTLGEVGLAHLRKLVEAAIVSAEPRPEEGAGEVIGWGTSGAVHRDRLDYDHRRRALRAALQDIADAEGDADAFIATLAPEDRRSIFGATTIAERLLGQGRVAEAWACLEAAEEGPAHLLPRLRDARIYVLEALGRQAEAQEMRWQAFEADLNAGHLRAYLKALPDFDDIEAEDRALGHVAAGDDKHGALVFLINWPALKRAGALVRATPDVWNGDYYEILRPAAEALDATDPLAATILRRAMILFTLEQARSKRYRHAVRHLQECESLASSIEDYGPVPTHDNFVTELRQDHGRKSGFWALVGSGRGN